MGSNKVEVAGRDSSSSGSEYGMVTCHALSASATLTLDSWIGQPATSN